MPPSLASSVVGPPSPSSVRGGDFTTGGDFLPAGKTFRAGGECVDEGNFGDDDEGGVYPDASPAEPSERAPGVSMPRPLATPLDPSGGAKLETMIEAILPCTTAQVRCCSSAPHFVDDEGYFLGGGGEGRRRGGGGRRRRVMYRNTAPRLLFWFVRRLGGSGHKRAMHAGMSSPFVFDA